MQHAVADFGFCIRSCCCRHQLLTPAAEATDAHQQLPLPAVHLLPPNKDITLISSCESQSVMDRLPLELVERIFESLPIADNFVYQSLCDKWRSAGVHTLSHWKSVYFCTYWKYKEAYKPGKNVLVLVQSVRDPEDKWMERMKCFVRLEKMIVDTCAGCLFPVLKDVVIRNCSTLTVLQMHTEPLPFDRKNPISYPNLKRLTCRGMTCIQAAAACPKLQYFRSTADVPIKALEQLPAEHMQHLNVLTPTTLKNATSEAVADYVTAVSRLTKLKGLNLKGLRQPQEQEWSEFHEQELGNLFISLPDLTDFRIEFRLGVIVSLDSAIEVLVQACPLVKYLELANICVSDITMQIISHMTRLLDLGTQKRGNQRNAQVTTAGIMHLLKGASRNVIEYMEMDMRSPADENLIREELLLMEQERGCVFQMEAVDKEYEKSIAIWMVK